MPKKTKKPILPENVAKAIALAKALKAVDDAYEAMDAVHFNPGSWLDLHHEIRDKVVSLLQEVEL